MLIILLYYEMAPTNVFEMSEITMREVIITKEPVELYKVLKFEAMVDSGGEAKSVIDQGLVSVNGEVETRKRKKLVSGDTIEFDNQEIQLVLK